VNDEDDSEEDRPESYEIWRCIGRQHCKLTDEEACHGCSKCWRVLVEGDDVWFHVGSVTEFEQAN
jgi:hypothetical protein